MRAWDDKLNQVEAQQGVWLAEPTVCACVFANWDDMMCKRRSVCVTVTWHDLAVAWCIRGWNNVQDHDVLHIWAQLSSIGGHAVSLSHVKHLGHTPYMQWCAQSKQPRQCCIYLRYALSAHYLHTTCALSGMHNC